MSHDQESTSLSDLESALTSTTSVLIPQLVALLVPFALSYLFKKLTVLAEKQNPQLRPSEPPKPFKVNEVSEFPGMGLP